jgi:hypothetical protein
MDPDGVSRDGLTSNAFWVISGMYHGDQVMKEAILETFHRLDSRYGIEDLRALFSSEYSGCRQNL